MDLSSIRKLSAEATPGKWAARGATFDTTADAEKRFFGSISFEAGLKQGVANAALIVAAVNLVRRLTDEGALERGARALLQQAFTPRGLTVTDEDWLALKDGTIAGLSAALNALLTEDRAA